MAILVAKGWREHLVPEMGKQLLILMSLLTGGNPRTNGESPTDELNDACFDCVGTLIRYMGRSKEGVAVFEDVGTRNIVDQLAYLLLEAVTDNPSDVVQISAAQALIELNTAITNPLLLASLLPRTVSSLVKALRPSTQARRTRKVLVTYLRLLTTVLRSVLADAVTFPDAPAGVSDADKIPTHTDVLGKSWLEATGPQVRIALTQVVRLRQYDAVEVRQALLELCLMVVEECSKTLPGCVPIAVETLVILSGSADLPAAAAALRHLVISRPVVADILLSKFFDWSQALPRIMQSQEDRPKQQILAQISTSLTTLSDASWATGDMTPRIASVLVDGVSAALEVQPRVAELVQETGGLSSRDLLSAHAVRTEFPSVLFNHPSHSSSVQELHTLIDALKKRSLGLPVVRSLTDEISDHDVPKQLAAVWLSINLLRDPGDSTLGLDNMIDLGETGGGDLSTSRPYLVSDLYALTLPYLLQSGGDLGTSEADPRLVALSLECVVLQAEQLGPSYRPELADTLFPALALLGSQNSTLQRHAIITFNLLASACRYTSAAQMVVENVDYLVNAVAMRLNSFDISRNGLQVLSLMVRLTGARLLPYLDDLIGSIFGAIDNFHGYPTLMEQLFDVLNVMVEESAHDPGLAITSGKEAPVHEKKAYHPSTVEDIVDDLHARRSRKRKRDDHELTARTPQRPWTSAVESEKAKHLHQSSSDMAEDGDEDTGLPPSSDNREKKAGLSRSQELLIKIAKAAVPHLTSPSPKVRQTLLVLLRKVSPLLARDEDTFLPLINAVWPAVVPRLLGTEDDGGPDDAAYNICAAAETISTICRGAGDFMTSRIEDIFPRLERLFAQTYAHAKLSKGGVRSPTAGRRPELRTHGAVRLQQADDIANVAQDEIFALQRTMGTIRTTDSQVLAALVDLLLSILLYVRISDDKVEKVFGLLEPFRQMPGTQKIREAMLQSNADALWLLESAALPQSAVDNPHSDS